LIRVDSWLLPSDPHFFQELRIEGRSQGFFRDLMAGLDRSHRRAIAPAVCEGFGGVDHPLAFFAPPMNYDLVVVGQADLIDTARDLAASAAER